MATLIQTLRHVLETKDPLLANDGEKKYSTQSAMLALKEKADAIRKEDLAADLLPMFESRIFIESWLDGFHNAFNENLKFYLEQI